MTAKGLDHAHDQEIPASFYCVRLPRFYAGDEGLPPDRFKNGMATLDQISRPRRKPQLTSWLPRHRASRRPERSQNPDCDRCVRRRAAEQGQY